MTTSKRALYSYQQQRETMATCRGNSEGYKTNWQSRWKTIYEKGLRNVQARNSMKQPTNLEVRLASESH
ncbi:hypothetical protein [Vibrio splendidus]|uniref:hypothetical protein n=1 Tax=Vibrio splendidus TaxID=29497 RepID=UPI000D3DA1FC|nr:hypothetical protein [Vibrio splendidus]PTO77084.1 hypothetical protein CWN81_00010 [Vibrio splendidus]